jgi:hypothetical protein
VSKFKVGDKVEIITNNYECFGLEKGSIITLDDFDGENFISIDNDREDFKTIYLGYHNIKLVEENEQVSDTFGSSVSVKDKKALSRKVSQNLKDIKEVVRKNYVHNEPKKYNSGKPIMSLVRPEFTLALADALTYGATKYDEKRGDTPNYLKGDGFHYSTIIDSLERHLNAFKSGINVDEESGKHHLALCAANLMFLHTYEVSNKGIDDRIKIKELDE